MALISAADLARVQAVVEGAGMPDAFALQRDVLTSDGAGGFTKSTSTVATSNCRLRSTNQQSQEQPIADRLGWVTAYSIDLPLSLQPTPKDRLVINGRTFEVGGILRGGALDVQQIAVVKEIG